MSLAGKTALVTGGGRGIGRAIASRLAKLGAGVVVAGRTRHEIDEAAGALGGKSLQLDVADRRAVTDALATLAKGGVRIDILVNNAGAAESAPFERTTDELWDRGRLRQGRQRGLERWPHRLRVLDGVLRSEACCRGDDARPRDGGRTHAGHGERRVPRMGGHAHR
jgi:hypothetical protein